MPFSVSGGATTHFHRATRPDPTANGDCQPKLYRNSTRLTRIRNTTWAAC